MEIELLGGFGEKGRTSVGIKSGRGRIVLDAGIKVGAGRADYYPEIGGSVGDIEALLISHAHEDHVGALSWLLSRGYRGRILMTAETCAEAPATLAGYADPEHLKSFPFPEDRVELFETGQILRIGDLIIETGRSGHVVGGTWFAVDDGSRRAVYSGDVVPDSSVFAMDVMPQCDLLILDASYGADMVSTSARVAAISAWIDTHSGGCLLPTPLSGRSLELIAALPGQFAVHTGMRASLSAQAGATAALLPGMPELLRARLSQAVDWMDDDPLPPYPLLADDGMGKAGPSSRLLPRADAVGFPILLTGHLPAGSPAEFLQSQGRADWIRMPTHPTLSGNLEIWKKAGRPVAIGHSCSPTDLEELGKSMPSLRTECRTGQRIALAGGKTG